MPCTALSIPWKLSPPRFGWLLLGTAVALHPVTPVVYAVFLPGAIVLGLGLWMAVSSKARFRAMDLPLPPCSKPGALLTDGWYRLTRNPMYLGIACVLLGAGLMLGTPAALLAAPVYMTVLSRTVVPDEEDALDSTWGEDWSRYARRVPSWL
jgi:protein-S-isoprenylcysteine O-methyltransferase Ste14